MKKPSISTKPRCANTGTSDGGISRDARRQPVTAQHRQFTEAPFNPLVNISQTLFESENLLANHRKTEMARFDDARVDGPHRNFMYTVAFHRYEGVAVDHGNRGRRGCVGVDQWVKAFEPRGVA